ncbi:MAG: signal peptide peptidase SppA [Hydrogenophilus sp.]|nr:signal peptide peptidase SppA [Hydrogenophilus sp.]
MTLSRLLLLPLRLLASLLRLLEMAGRLVVGLIALLIALLTLALLFTDWHRAPAPHPLPERFLLHLALEGPITERPAEDPLDLLFGDPHQQSLAHLLETLETARTDPRVIGVALDLSRLGSATLAQLDELRGQLTQLRAAGKSVHAYADAYTQKSYFLASIADEIVLDPDGHLLLPGLAFYPTYLKAALDALGIEVHAFRAGRHKSFIEPFTRTEMSADERANLEDLLHAIWQRLRDAIAAARRIPPAEIERYHTQFDALLAAADGDPAQTALNARLVDRLESQSAWEARLLAAHHLSGRREALVPWHRYRLTTRALDSLRRRSGEIRVIPIDGAIVEEEDSEEAVAAAVSLVEHLTAAAEDPHVRAVVLRIASPGGSAFAAETIRRTVEHLQQSGKPVIASLAGVAASGGYWLAAPADLIVATPYTLTGSIGVFALLPNLSGLLEKLHLSTDGVATGPFAAALDPRLPLSERVADALQRSVDHTYRRFLTVVADGRKLPLQEVAAVAEGRVWLGETAQKLGLIDRLGGLNDAIALARERANAPDAAVTWPAPSPNPAKLLRRLLVHHSPLPAGSIVSSSVLPPSLLLLLTAQEAADSLPLLRRLFTDPPTLDPLAHCLCTPP